MILIKTVNPEVDLMLMKLSELFKKVDSIQQMKNSFLIMKLLGWLRDLAEGLLHSLQLSIDLVLLIYPT